MTIPFDHDRAHQMPVTGQVALTLLVLALSFVGFAAFGKGIDISF